MNKIVSAHDRQVENRKKSAAERCQRLRTAIALGGGVNAVARAAGVANTTISTYSSGRDMKASIAVAIAEACGVSVEWLMTGRGEMAQNPDLQSAPAVPDGSESIAVPFLQSEASAGTGIEPVEWGRDVEVSVPIDFLHSLIGFIPKQIFFMKVRGDSMTPTIHTGDTVIINYAQSPLRDGIYAISVNGMAMIKRIGMKSPKTYSIISDNPFYERFDVSIKDICWGTAQPDAEVRVIGRVIGNFHLENDAFLPGQSAI